MEGTRPSCVRHCPSRLQVGSRKATVLLCRSQLGGPRLTQGHYLGLRLSTWSGRPGSRTHWHSATGKPPSTYERNLVRRPSWPQPQPRCRFNSSPAADPNRSNHPVTPEVRRGVFRRTTGPRTSSCRQGQYRSKQQLTEPGAATCSLGSRRPSML